MMYDDLAAQMWQPSAAGLLDLALALACGIVLLRFPHVVRPGLTVRALPSFAAGLAAIALLAYVTIGSAAMTGGDWDSAGAFFADIHRVLTQSHFGAMQCVAALGVAMLAYGAWRWHRVRKVLAMATLTADDPCHRHHRREHNAERPARGIFTAGALLLALSRAATGHAADAGLFSAAVAIHTVHVLAAASWTGVLLVAYCALAGGSRWPVGARAAYGERLSSMATFALLVVLCSGLLNAWRTLGNAPIGSIPLTTSAYGAWLSAKLILITVATLLGAWNRWQYLPRLVADDRTAQRAFARLVAIEALVLVLVMTVAAKLGTTMPPG